jgi:hypothetical protein
VTIIQKPHTLGGFGLTPNVIAQTSAKVALASRFLGLVGSLPLDEQKLWLEMYTVQDNPPPPSEFLQLPPLGSLYKSHVRNQKLPQPGDSRPVMSPSQRAFSKQMMKYWEPWETNMQKSTNSRMLQQLAFHT